MALGPGQKELYTDRVNIWGKTSQANQDDVFTLLYANVPCKFEYTINVDDPNAIASEKRESIFTTDIWHGPLVDDRNRKITVPNGAYFVNVTPGNPNYGGVEISLGAANLLPGAGARSGLNKQKINIMTEEHPPVEVLAGVVLP